MAPKKTRKEGRKTKGVGEMPDCIMNSIAYKYIAGW
jgi:hypothetical protein